MLGFRGALLTLLFFAVEVSSKGNDTALIGGLKETCFNGDSDNALVNPLCIGDPFSVAILQLMKRIHVVIISFVH